MRKRTKIIVLAMSLVVVMVVASYLSLFTGPYHVRPYGASGDKVALSGSDLPSGWRLNVSYPFDYEDIPSTGGWNWAVESWFNNTSDGRSLTLYTYVSSYNSTGLAEDQYQIYYGAVTAPLQKSPLEVGEEGFTFFSLGKTRAGEKGIYFIFREGNIVVESCIIGEPELTTIEPWMKDIMKLQDEKIKQSR